MPTRWFRLPEAGSGTDDDPARPDLFGHEDDGIARSANRIPTEGPGDDEAEWVAHVGAPADVLDDIASQPEASQFGALPAAVLNRHFGQSRGAAEWAQSFRVTDPAVVNATPTPDEGDGQTPGDGSSDDAEATSEDGDEDGGEADSDSDSDPDLGRRGG